MRLRPSRPATCGDNRTDTWYRHGALPRQQSANSCADTSASMFGNIVIVFLVTPVLN